MILSSFNYEDIYLKFTNNTNSNNTNNNYCKYYIKLSTIIFDFEKFDKNNIYYKIDIIIKYNNDKSYNLNPLYNYSKNTNFTFYVYKNMLTDKIIYYLNACDYELQLYCNNILEFRKLLIIFLYYLNENISLYK
jgi:hypothetical protein